MVFKTIVWIEKKVNKGVEQFTKADLLAVTLFEDREDGANQKGVPAYAGGLVQPLGFKSIKIN